MAGLAGFVWWVGLAASVLRPARAAGAKYCSMALARPPAMTSCPVGLAARLGLPHAPGVQTAVTRIEEDGAVAIA